MVVQERNLVSPSLGEPEFVGILVVHLGLIQLRHIGWVFSGLGLVGLLLGLLSGIVLLLLLLVNLLRFLNRGFVDPIEPIEM